MPVIQADKKAAADYLEGPCSKAALIILFAIHREATAKAALEKVHSALAGNFKIEGSSLEHALETVRSIDPGSIEP